MAHKSLFWLALCFTLASSQQLHRGVNSTDPQSEIFIANAAELNSQNLTNDTATEQTLVSTAVLRCGISGMACGTSRCPCSIPVAAAFCNQRRPGICGSSCHTCPAGPAGPRGPRGLPGARGLRGLQGRMGALICIKGGRLRCMWPHRDVHSNSIPNRTQR
jgi:hypothetical protein